MKPTKQLINGLHKAAAMLRDPAVPYDWMLHRHCNCGVLARALGADIDNARPTFGCWRHEAEYLYGESPYGECVTTGLPLTSVFAVMAEAGLDSVSDIRAIETCTLDPLEPPLIDFKNRHVVADFFEKLAEDLAKQLPA